MDTGFANTPKEYIFPAIRKLDRKPEEISNVVITHRDRDHIEGNRIIKEITKAQIAVHELEAEEVDTVDIMLKDGDVVELGDRKFRVLYTPGHRPGNICLYDQYASILITGDTVCGDRTDLIRVGKEMYIKSLMKLLNLDIKVLVMSHPFKPMGKSILTENKPKEMIQASIDIAEKL